MGQRKKKEKKWHKPRHTFWQNFTRLGFKTFLFFSLGTKVKTHKRFKEGCIILSNHTTDYDQFLVGCSFRGCIYYVASKHIFQNPLWSRLLKYSCNPILKEKNKPDDLDAVFNIYKCAKENQQICIFCEGNRTYSGNLCYISPAIAKLVKRLKKPLVFYNIVGGYGVEPRWAVKHRKGKIEGKIRRVYQYEEIENLSVDEIYNLIIENLTVDEYNPEVNVISDFRAEYLERLFFKCPVCGEYHKLRSDGNYLICDNCNIKILYNEHLEFITDNKDFKFKRVGEWYDWQLDELRKLDIKDNEVIFENEIYLEQTQLFAKNIQLGKFLLKMYNDRFDFVKSDGEIHTFNFKDVGGITMVGKKRLEIYSHGEIYRVMYDDRINLIKYMFMFYIIKNKNENNNSTFVGI